MELRPVWERCDMCDDFICNLHPGQHAHECPCPGIETWYDVTDQSPYSFLVPVIDEDEEYD